MHQQQQQRTARIDQIMKLFPEQNGLLMNSLQQQQQQQLQSQSTLQQPSSISMLTASQNNINRNSLSGIVNSGYPHAMDCDPSPIASSINPRYNVLIGGNGNGNSSSTNSSSGHPHVHRSNRYPSLTTMGLNNQMTCGNGGHTNKSNSNLLNNYAPTSLPIDLGQIIVGGGSNTDNSSSGLSSAYQHHILSGSNSTGSYIPYSMSTESMQGAEAAMKHQLLLQQQQESANSKNIMSSNSSSGTSSVQTSSASRSNGSKNDRGDESPMVGVCVQQSPVVIH